jgi:hypothetical protein
MMNPNCLVNSTTASVNAPLVVLLCWAKLYDDMELVSIVCVCYSFFFFFFFYLLAQAFTESKL